VIFVAPNELGHPRLGITVTRKAGKSHVRNRLRRWVREVYRRSRNEIGLEGHSVDIVVNVKPAAAGSDFAPFADDLRKVLGRVGRVPRT
jgi:ribonuclease P protein component